MKLVVLIKKSSIPEKKYTAIFHEGDQKKRTVHFGQRGADDYTKGATDEQRTSYRSRHAKDRINDPMTPGSLAWHILWGSSRSFEKNVSAFKKKFKLG